MYKKVIFVGVAIQYLNTGGSSFLILIDIYKYTVHLDIHVVPKIQQKFIRIPASSYPYTC